ncbi:class I SAM-dependent methyltransferase [Blastococcus sp. VKM Ac-2987]|uniref:class I SAM-dependent methyltransferase n=1 Tax=Blastococcus sp. VKM Ac-2987 TaxID=3004141 RepID=UPI0022AB6C25|nr:class I SAM-dependent methyltransferase [Blastococcus sp. VKM Ac-2987]MCZ2858493.1 class I SAM-dependent methyltransferase [Blastococcus sp. VKM Ac-2987]
MSAPHCRLCSAPLVDTFVDLGMSPPCESYLTADQLDTAETFYPLHVRICARCLLVQLPAYIDAGDIFSHYAYFSSYSDSWVAHAKGFVEEAVGRLGLGPDSFIVEVASNDGYLLEHVVHRGIRALGIEPAANVAEAAVARGVPTEVVFLGEATGADVAARHGAADLVVANNVFAHVPDIVDFARGLRRLVADGGTVTIEIPHLLRLIEGNEYDTIYHEHYSYLSLLTTQRVLAEAGLVVVDVEELPTHGGSLRTWSMPAESATPPSAAVAAVLADERAAGLSTLEGHAGFALAVARVRNDLVEFLVERSRRGETVVAYGAPGKGNTLLNHCGVRSDLVAFSVDRNPFKQGRFLPGTHIPIHAPEALAEARPDYVLIMPWNLREEISDQLSYVRDWGGRLVVALPRLEIL